jgi:hypothetical protein
VTFPDPPVAGNGLPFASPATTPLTTTPIVVEDGLAAIWNVATATTPSAKVVLFPPKTTQVAAEHLSVFPAVLMEIPGTTVTLVMSDE